MKACSTLIGITSCLLRSSTVSVHPMQKCCVVGMLQYVDVQRRNYSGRAPVRLMGLGKGKFSCIVFPQMLHEMILTHAYCADLCFLPK